MAHHAGMTHSTAEPLDRAGQDAKARASRVWTFLRDHAEGFGTRLVALIGTAGMLVGLALLVLPFLVAAGLGVVIVLLVTHGIYARRGEMSSERMRRHFNVTPVKRVEQHKVRADLAIDEAILALVGEPSDRQVRDRAINGHPELRQAVRCLAYQAHQAALGDHPQPAKARRRQPAAPAKPDLAAVRRRRDHHHAELDALEAEIQAAALPDAPRRREARQLRRQERALRDAAREADRVARNRARRGSPPTSPEGELRFAIDATSGLPTVEDRGRPRTPETITADALEQDRSQ